MSDWNNTHELNRMYERDLVNAAERMAMDEDDEHPPKFDATMLEGVRDPELVWDGLEDALMQYAADHNLHDFNNDVGACHCVFCNTFTPMARNMERFIVAKARGE